MTLNQAKVTNTQIFPSPGLLGKGREHPRFPSRQDPYPGEGDENTEFARRQDS